MRDVDIGTDADTDTDSSVKRGWERYLGLE